MRTLSFVLALSCIVLQTRARAGDACLTGDSTLSDQRSLASLADATDAACPCATAASGRSYQRCARDILRAQLTGGAVRPECEKAARLDLRGTACGTAKVACGAAPISGDGSPLCGLARPSACRDSRRLDRGLDVYLVTERDPRVTVAVAMAPAALTKPHLDVPSLTMTGAIDSVVDNTLTRAAYDASVTPKLLVEIEHAGHFAFSDGCFPSPDCNPPTTLTQPEAHGDVLRYVVPFIERYLGGEEKVMPLLGSPTGPGFVYQASF